MVKVGDAVKIEDIGQLGICVRISGKEACLELCGERFWIPLYLLHSVGDDLDEAV